jgi:hypothetical protein
MENNKMDIFTWEKRLNSIVRKEIGIEFKDLSYEERDAAGDLFMEGLTPEEAAESLFFSASDF